jgi:hypothetical protein
MAWFKVAKGRLEYRNRITRDAFTLWTATTEGTGAIERVASGIRFSIVGRHRTARRRTWLALDAAVREEAVAAAIRAEADHYMAVLASLSYSALPRAHVALRRVVLVPRAMIAGRARGAMYARLGAATALGQLDDAVRVFFLEQLLTEMDAAIQKASPSPRYPVQAADGWTCIGVEKGLVWVDPLWSGPDGTGHVFMYEFPPAGLPRRDRKALDAALAEMRGRVSLLSRSERHEMVRAALAQ